MSKAFTKETENDDDLQDEVDVIPSTQKNYMTPFGIENLKAEYQKLMRDERSKVVEVVSWAAGNGDRSENGDYIYGKKRLREIDRRIRYLTKRIESAEVVDPLQQNNLAQVFFGATVTYRRNKEAAQTVTIVGVDEADMAAGKISWLSPVARAVLRSEVGDVIELKTPAGTETIEITEISYKK